MAIFFVYLRKHKRSQLCPRLLFVAAARLDNPHTQARCVFKYRYLPGPGSTELHENLTYVRTMNRKYVGSLHKYLLV